MGWSGKAFAEFLPILWLGAQYTALLSILALAISLVLGLAIALGRLSHRPGVSGAMAAYISFIRGTPLLVQLLYVYFALPEFGIKLTPLQAAVVGLSLNEAAYLAEVYRAGIESIARGQLEAAYSIGMSHGQAMRRVILPQALRVVLPPLGNSAIILLKNSSLASVISVGELMRQGEVLAASTFRNMQIYTMVAALYWIMHYPLARLTRWLERRMARA